MRKSEGSWIKEYLKYTQGQESPDLFHIWVAMTMIASILDRKVKLHRGYYELFPNIFVILVAGAGRCRKSTALRMGTSLINEDSLEAQIQNTPRIFAQKITNARLIEFLAEGVEADLAEGTINFRASGLIAAPELSSFLGKGAMEKGIITTLTDLYDCPEEWTKSTKSSGTNRLENVYLNMIGASTGKWLRNAIPGEAVGGGFISRSIFVYQDQAKQPIAFPEDNIPEDAEEIKQNLVDDLATMSNLEGNFSFSSEAKEWYRDWYENEAQELQQTQDEAFFSRWPQHLLKVAMICSVAQNDKLELTLNNMQRAKMYLDAVYSNIEPVINTMTVAESELPTNKVLGLIRRRGEVDHETLSRYTKKFVKSEGLKSIIETLEDSGEIEAVWGAKDKRKYQYIGETNIQEGEVQE